MPELSPFARLKVLKPIDTEGKKLSHVTALPKETTADPNTLKQREYVVTEYRFAKGDTEHQLEVAKSLKDFFTKAQESFGPYIPQSDVVLGHPSSPDGETQRTKNALYVIQRYDNRPGFLNAKNIYELNEDEFSAQRMATLLELYDRINQFSQANQELIQQVSGFLNPKVLEARSLKDQVLAPADGNFQITSLFHVSPELVKKATDSRATYQPGQKYQVLRYLGLSNVARLVERSGLGEALRTKSVIWSLTDKEKLKQYRQEHHGRKAMALTFDDGPNEETLRLLDILKDKGVKATFMIAGDQIEGREAIIKRIIEEGHDLGIHEWHHVRFPGEKPSVVQKLTQPLADLGNVKRCHDALSRICQNNGYDTNRLLGRIAGFHGKIETIREFAHFKLPIVLGCFKDVFDITPKMTHLRPDEFLDKAIEGNAEGAIRLFHIGHFVEGYEDRQDSLDQVKTRNLNRKANQPPEVYFPEVILRTISDYIDQSREQGYDFVQAKDYISASR